MMYLIISKDGGFCKQEEISDDDIKNCDECQMDIVDINEPDYPKYLADGEWWHL